MYEVDGSKGADSESGDKWFPVKNVLAIPAGLVMLTLQLKRGPGPGRRVTMKEHLQEYARILGDRISSSTGLRLAMVAKQVRSMRGAIDTMDIYVYTKKMLRPRREHRSRRLVAPAQNTKSKHGLRRNQRISPS